MDVCRGDSQVWPEICSAASILCMRRHYSKTHRTPAASTRVTKAFLVLSQLQLTGQRSFHCLTGQRAGVRCRKELMVQPQMRDVFSSGQASSHQSTGTECLRHRPAEDQRTRFEACMLRAQYGAAKRCATSARRRYRAIGSRYWAFRLGARFRSEAERQGDETISECYWR